jgi:fibronectin type 3 domain-containing protein
MGRLRMTKLLTAAAALVLLATCSNPVDLVEKAKVEVMKANDRYLEVESFSPSSNDANVNPGGSIVLALDRAVDMTTVTTQTVKIVKNLGGAEVDWIASFDVVTHTLTIRPTPYLDNTTAYTITLDGIKGEDGSDLLETMSWGFTTGVAPAGAVTLTGSGDAGYTNSTSVTVTVTPNAYADEYAVSLSAIDPTNTSGLTWALSTASTPITIAATEGSQTVYAIFRGEVASKTAFSVVYEPSIIYDSVAPNAPVVSGETSTTTRKPTWSWTSGGDGKGSYRYRVDSGSWVETSETSYTSASDLALGAHSFDVQERDYAGNWSASGSQATAVVPTAPTNLVASDSTDTSQVNLSWSASSGASAYYIDRATSASGTYTNIGNTASTSYGDTTAVRGTIYYYQVRAYAAGYYSASSDYDMGSRRLLAPTSVSATDDTVTSGVTVSWVASSGATSYYIDRATSDTGTYSNVGSSTTTSYTDTSATPAVVYYYKVRAAANGYDSDRSSSDSGSRRLAAPTSVAATDNTLTAQVTVSWAASTGASLYYVDRSTSATGTYTNIGSTTSTSLGDITATPAVVYYYKVRAYANGYYSDSSSYNSGVRSLTAPTSVAATDNTLTSQVTVSWAAVSGAALYYVDRSTSSTGTYTNIGNTASTSYADTAATPAAVYYYKVRAYANTYFSASSSYDSGVRKLTAPTISATDNSNTSEVTVTWSAISGAASYLIYRSTYDGGYASLGTSTTTSYSDTTATAAVLYYYKAYAYANGYYSDISSYNTGVRQLAAPLNVSASAGTDSTGIAVSWNSVTSAASYYVYRSTSATSGYSCVGSGLTSTSWTDTSVTSYDVTYYYKVLAYANGYASPFSAYDTGYRGLAAPSSFSATDGSSIYVALSWGAVTDATGYCVYRSASPYLLYSLLGSTTGTSYNDSTATYNTTYKYKVRAYKTSTSYVGVSSLINSGWRWNINSSTELSGRWPFESSWYDYGYGNSVYDDLTAYTGAPSFSSTYKVVGTYSAYFDGVDDKRATSTTSTTFMTSARTSVSVAFWVRPNTTYSSITYLMMGNDFSISQSNTNRITIAISIPSTNSAYTTVTTGAWTHIVGTYDGSTIKIYNNGSLAMSTAHAGTVSNPGRAFSVGGYSSIYWNGYIDDLRIYNRVLTASEIAGLYSYR